MTVTLAPSHPIRALWQAARVLGMRPSSVARLCRQGKLPARRNPQRRRWDYPRRRCSTPMWLIRLPRMHALAVGAQSHSRRLLPLL